MAFDRVFEGPPTTGAPASASLAVDLTNKTLYIGGGSLVGWQEVTASGSPTGVAGGDLSGNFPNPVVAQVNGAAVPVSAPLLGSNSSGQLVAETTVTVSGATPTVAAGQVGFGVTTAASATAGAATLPATPVGFLEVNIGGTVFKLPYYAV